ncbi:hypothetical protein HBH64_017700 [Parastagonospora nodorum]|nr:hypothetical protein HBH53_170230 [Parastagonospora nodorum]KAH4073134.1 hypothetical protein HBH50_050280 [Parastagonospora nodorum]KAH4099810.1 hypothetical protein HBH48_011880 [Parastagonospora nodorum]KAH4111308.1 hypothetical protein HBH46_011420 [Parastagonospora nodorum]KAH4299043.1 hypothetical protein HBI01_126800 [Parastagonospora nodorum]
MADIGPRLSLELTRIVSCRYPASLLHLAELLAHADVQTVRACIYERSPCEVSRLTALVCEALDLWPYTLGLILSLCQSPEFANTLLLHNPNLLDALLVKATSSPRGFDECADLCVLLLSRPLPASMILPASAQAFFLRVFENAKANIEASTLKPVYLMLNGACRDLLSLLPAARRENFDQALLYILRSNSISQNFMLMVWYFGIVLLTEYPSETGSSEGLYSSIEHAGATAPKQWTTASGRILFDASDKYKAINLTYLSVIYVTKGGEGVSYEDAIEGIRIAVCVLRCVDRKALRAWPTSSSNARNIFSKLPLKILRADIDPTIQLEASCFYAMMVGECNLPNELVSQYQRCLENTADVTDTGCLDETLLISLPLYSAQMQETTFQTLLTHILGACISPPGTRQLSNLKVLAERMTTAMTTCDSLRTKMLSAVSRSEAQRKIWEIVRTEPEQDVTCCAYGTALHQQMTVTTIALLLTLALTAQSAESRMPLALTTALVGKHTQLSHAPNQCTHSVSRPDLIPVSLFQQKSTPYTGQHLYDWRDRLKSDLDSQGSFQRDSVVRAVAQIVQDLETRCNTVEEPLRREKEKNHGLEQHVAKLNERIGSLEVQAADDRFHAEGLEDEKLIISEERDSLVAKLKDVESEADEAIRKAEEMLMQVREDYNAKEVELRSTRLTSEETIRALEKGSEDQHTALVQLRRDFTHAELERTALEEQLEALRHCLDDAEASLGEKIEMVHSQSKEIAQLNEQRTELELQLQGTETDLDTVTTQLSDLQVSHQELVQSSEEAYRNLERRYTGDLEAAIARAQLDREELNAKLQGAIDHAQRAETSLDATRGEVQQLQALIPPLEKQVQELTEFCSEQEEELEELRTIRRNVLATMGFASEPGTAGRSTSRGQKDAADPPAQTPRMSRVHRHRKPALQDSEEAPRASRGTQGATSTAMEFVANASFASSDSHSSQNGSTPKRRKPRPSFKIPAMQTPYTQKPVLSSRSVSKKLSPIKRSALRQLSPNRRHTTVGFTVSENEAECLREVRSGRKRRGSLAGVEEADFDMEDFLAGTPLTPGNFTAGTGRMPDEDDDATATEL